MRDWQSRIKKIHPTKKIKEEADQLASETGRPVLVILDKLMLLDGKETSVYQVYAKVGSGNLNRPCSLHSSALFHILSSPTTKDIDEYIPVEFDNILKKMFPEVYGYLSERYTRNEIAKKMSSFLSYNYRRGFVDRDLGRYGSFYFISDDIEILDYRDK